jgi:hypothetical protein
MTTKLEVFKAELGRLEAEDRYDALEYDYLAEMVERLEAEEKAAAPAAQTSATSTQVPADPVAALVAELEAAHANPGKYTDEQLAQLVKRYNAQVIEAGRPQRQATDLAQLRQRIVVAGANPDALDDSERDALVRDWNQATPGHRSVAELRADLDSQDFGKRLEAAEALQRRGEELPEGLVEKLTGEDFLAWQVQQHEAARDPANYSAEMGPVVEAFVEAEAHQARLARPVDPVSKAVGMFNDAVRAVRPPTPEETLAALGVEPEPAGSERG